MYKLYNVKAWGSLAIHCLLEEMDVPYTNIWMTPEQVRAPEFRAISPLGMIPALGLADGRSLYEFGGHRLLPRCGASGKAHVARARKPGLWRVHEPAAFHEH